MNEKYILQFKAEIQNLVNSADPWFLIEIGAPDDEYNVYIDKITSFVLNKKPTLIELERELEAIFKTNEFTLENNVMKNLAAKIIEIKI